MADNQNLSVQEILAACRKMDGAGDDAEAVETVPAAAAEVTPKPKVEKSKPVAHVEKKDPGKMSVAEMLAAAREEKSSGGESPKPVAAKPEKEAAVTASSGAAKLDPKKMSVAEMMAAARGEKSKGGAPTAKPAAKKAAPAAKSAAKPAAKASPKAAAKPQKSGPMDTSSILAAARSASKPGPITKAEAASKSKPAPPAKEKKSAPPMPSKPPYAKPVARAAKEEPSRRGVLAIVASFLAMVSSPALGFSTLTMVTGLMTLGTARFFFPNLLVEPPSRFKVGFPGDFASGTVETKFKAQFGIWLVNAEYQGVQEIVALKSVCTHLGCTPNWLEAEQKFKCPCHGSGFYKDGINFEGPAPRPLERYAIRVADDGQIEVDKSKTYQEQLGQWNDNASFVLA